MKAARALQEKQEENDRDQDHSLGQVVHDRVQGVVQQVAAVQHGNHLHAGWQNAVVELVHFVVDGLERGFLFRAFAQQHAALDDVRLIDDAPILHVVGPGHVAQADLRALRDVRNIFDPQGGAGLGFQDSLLDVVARC